jgi:hypothetical protein
LGEGAEGRGARRADPQREGASRAATRDRGDPSTGMHLQSDGGIAPLDQRRGDAERGEDLEGARLDGQRPGLVHPVGLPVDDTDACAVCVQLRGEA